MPERRPDLADRLGHAVGLLGVHARPPARRAGAAAARCTAPAPPPPASGRRRRGRRRACAACRRARGTRRSRRRARRAPCPRGWPAGAAGPDARNPALVRWWRPSMRFSATDWVPDSAMFWNARATPMPAIWKGRIWSRRCVAEADLALGGLVDARQDVEHRRLAGAVRPDDRVDRPGLDGERHLGQGLDGSEPDADVVDLDRPGCPTGCSPAARRAAVTPSTARASCPTPVPRVPWWFVGVAVVPEIEALHLVGLGELARVTGERHLADVQHVGQVGDPERHGGVLLHQQHRRALPVDLGDDLADLADDAGREAERRLVEQEQLRAGHQRTADGQHLLLAAGQQAAALRTALLEHREHLVDAVLGLRLRGLVLARPCRRHGGSPPR